MGPVFYGSFALTVNQIDGIFRGKRAPLETRFFIDSSQHISANKGSV